MSDIKVPPFTDGQKELIKTTEKLANGRKICDVDGIDDDIKDIKEILKEAITKIENQKQTNFQRITASPEALAKWVCKITDFCDRGCSHCPIQEKCLYDADGAGNSEIEEMLVEWLKQESK